MSDLETGLFFIRKPKGKSRRTPHSHHDIDTGPMPEPTPIPLTGVKVSGDILGRSARIKVAQTFKNVEDKPIEAVYRFPLPESAAVSKFTARIGDRTITGQIEDKERAFEIYDDALSQGHGAYLMDQERPNIFTLSVGNLNPDTEVAIEIEYVELLDMEGPRARFFLPTTISPRYIPADMDKGADIPTTDRIHPEYALDVPYGLTLSLNIHDGRLLESVESPSHPISVDMKSDPVNVSLSQDSTRMDRDFILYLGIDQSSVGRAYSTRINDETFIQLDMLITKESLDALLEDSPEKTAPPKKEVVFLIDCSGSMHGDSIQEARKALEICTRALEPGSTFNIVRFGSTFESLFKKPNSYDEKSLKEALSYLKNMEADLGGTEVYSPLKHVLESSSDTDDLQRKVILITDGQVGNENQVMGLVWSHSSHTSFFTIGIGAGYNEHFIKGLSRAGNGASEFISPGERIEPKVLRLFQKISDHVVTDAGITWPADSVTEAPSKPALFLDSPVSVFARSEGPFTAGTITVLAEVNSRPCTWEFPVTELEEAIHPIDLFWARERIRDLEERGEEVLDPGSKQKGRKARRLDNVIQELSKRYGLISQSTSFVAVEEREEKDKTTGELQLRKVPVPITIGWHGMGSVHGNEMLHERDLGVTVECSKMESSSVIHKLEMCTDLLPTVHRDHTISKARETIPLEIPSSDTDLVLAILATQKADGGMELTKELAELLDLDYMEFKNAVTKLTLPNPQIDAHTLLSTTVLLQVLESRFISHSSTWSKVVKKSRKWMQKITTKYQVMIGNEDMHSWVGMFLRTQS